MESTPGALADAYGQHRGSISILMAGHHLRGLNRMYRAFEGDLLLPIVLSEIGLSVLRAMLAERSGSQSELAARAMEHPHRLSDLAQRTGIPRETTRRKIKSLVATGWLREVVPGTVSLAPRAVDYFGYAYNREVLNDFFWTADRLREVVAYDDDALRRADLRRALAAALATREEEHVEPLFSVQFTPPAALPVDRFDERLVQLANALVAYWLRHLYRLRDAFGGDLLLPLLLGEVAHYGVGALMYRQGAGLATLDALLVDAEQSADLLAKLLRSCNAHSISLVTRIPDSSVRRKLAVLVERGWLTMTPDGGYLVTGQPSIEFAALNLETLNDFVATDARLRQLLSAPLAALSKSAAIA